jgi:hypothetical protein
MKYKKLEEFKIYESSSLRKTRETRETKEIVLREKYIFVKIGCSPPDS